MANPDFITDIDLGDPCYLDGTAMFVYAYRCAHTDTSTKVVYQVTPKLPQAFRAGPGAHPNATVWYDRSQIMTPDEFSASELERLDDEAYVYSRTLTGRPMVTFLGDATEYWYYDGTNSFLGWDGTNFDSTVSGPYTVDGTDYPGGPWIDPGATVTDLEELVTGTITHDGTTYTIDTTEYTLVGVFASYDDGTNAPAMVPAVDLSVAGVYSVAYMVLDTAGFANKPNVPRLVVVTTDDPRIV